MILDETNFILYAMHHYDNAQCVTVEEFENDLRRFTYLNKLFIRYRTVGDLKERLILNHIIILYNVFGNALNDMLFLKIEKVHWSALTTFLVYLKRIPEDNLYKIELDQTIINVLREI